MAPRKGAAPPTGRRINDELARATSMPFVNNKSAFPCAAAFLRRAANGSREIFCASRTRVIGGSHPENHSKVQLLY